MKTGIRIAAAALALGLLTSCGSVRIRNILNNPVRYQNRDVTVNGRVSRSVGMIVAGYYQVEDGTGRIGVISNGMVPPKGAQVTVKGRVSNGVTVMNRSFGTTIRERDLRVR